MKIVVICPNWVGDAVMATPALRALRHRYPRAEIHAVGPRPVVDTLAANPWINRYIVPAEIPRTAPFPWLDLLRTLRAERYDLGVLFPGSFGSALTLFLAGAKSRVGYDRELRGFLLTDALPAGWTPRGYTPSPIIDYYLRLTGRLGADARSRRMELFVSDEDRRSADDLWRKFHIGSTQKVVALNPGGAFGPAKRWPAKYFAELARRIVDELFLKVLVLCGPAERDLARSIAADSERAQSVHSLADEKVSIGLTKAIVERSSLLVSTDSGPRHFAAALGIPVVSLFGPTHIAWTETYYEREIKLQKTVPCGPCQKRTCPFEHHRCMKDLTVAEVHQAAIQAMRLGRSIERAA